MTDTPTKVPSTSVPGGLTLNDWCHQCGIKPLSDKKAANWVRKHSLHQPSKDELDRLPRFQRRERDEPRMFRTTVTKRKIARLTPNRWINGDGPAVESHVHMTGWPCCPDWGG